MAIEPAEERLTHEEFLTEARHKGVPAQSVSWPRFVLAALMLVLGVGALIAGVALVYWKAALILGGVVLIGGVFFVNVLGERE